MKKIFFSHKTKIACLTLAALGFAAGAQAQYVLGSFMGSGDPTNTGWVNGLTGSPVTSDPSYYFTSGVVAGYTQSLGGTVFGHVGGFGYPTLELQMTPAEITAFNANNLLTFTFSVATGGATSGYFQIYNLALNAPGPGYANLASGGNGSWATHVVSETGDTGSIQTSGNAQGEPNFYMYNGENPVVTMTVTLDYSSAKAAIIAGGESYLDIIFQGNNGGSGQATEFYFNNVYLSTPEPATGAMLLAGGAMALFLARRRVK